MTPRYTTNPGWVIGDEELIHQIGDYDIYRARLNGEYSKGNFQVFVVWGGSTAEEGAWANDSRITNLTVRDYCQAYLNLLS